MMQISQTSRSALMWSLVLGCSVGISFPLQAAPADIRIVTPGSDKVSTSEKANDPVRTDQSSTGVGSQFELIFWQSVATSDDADQLQTYLARYPNGTFSGLARAKIAALARQAGPAVAAATAKPPAPAAVPAAASAAISSTAASSTGAKPLAAADDDLVGAAAAIPGAADAIVRTPVPPAQTALSTKAAPPAKVVKLAPVPSQPDTATAAAAPSVSPSLAAQLRALGQSQGHRSETVAMQQATPPSLREAPPTPRQLIAIPSRPKLASVPKVALPNHFCSAMERHNFYNSVYGPARRVAEQNDQTATGHMLKLQSIHDDYAQRQDQAATDAISVEVRDYEALASDAHHASTDFEGLLDSLMAVPVRQCGESA